MSIKYGYQSQHNTEVYDRQFNRLYISILTSKKSGNLFKSDSAETHNIAIYDIGLGTTRYLFETAQADLVITHLLFEESWKETYQQIEFNRSSSHVQNSHLIPQRELIDRLFVCVQSKTTKKNTLWTFRKSGDDKQLIAEFDEQTNWYLDVFNQKIRLLKRIDDKVEVRDFDW